MVDPIGIHSSLSLLPAEFPWDQVQQVEYQDANTGTIVQACHAMIHSPTSARLLSDLSFRSWIMMQMRFDGKLGFPGGIVSDLGVPDSTLEDALNREMEEEIGLNLTKFKFTKQHHVVSHYCPWANIILNFYAQKLDEHDFKEIEAAAVRAFEHGHECLGLVRVPLFTMHDGQSGLPSFLRNQFAGISILQAMVGLRTQKIISEEELKLLLHALPKNQSYYELLNEAVLSYAQRTALRHKQ